MNVCGEVGGWKNIKVWLSGMGIFPVRNRGISTIYCMEHFRREGCLSGRVSCIG